MDYVDLHTWEFLVSCLSDGVLWDEDWKDSESILDADPQKSLAVKEILGIDEGCCYVAVPPDPTEEEIGGVLATLRVLTSNAQRGDDTNGKAG